MPDKHQKETDSEKAQAGVHPLGDADSMDYGQSVPPPEVRAVVPERDDIDEPCETLRAYFLGTLLSVIGTGLNMWFGARQPGIYLSPFLAQVVAHPLGKMLERVTPRYSLPLPLAKRRIPLNPGKWSVKEHTLVTIMCTVSLPTATAVDVILALKNRYFFHDTRLGDSYGFQFLLVLSTQFLGFGLAGMAREYLVYPSDMVWPLNLAKVTLFNALHRRQVDAAGNVVLEEDDSSKKEEEPPIHGWRVSMFRFSLYAMVASFVWLFFTALIMPFLAFFNWPTWISPQNVRLAVVMGTLSGFGLNPIPTFDWTFINAAGLTPLITPFWATLSLFAGSCLGLVLCCAVYFSNTWYAAYLLPNSNAAFDRFGSAYNVTRVLDPVTKTLDEEAFSNYSPIYFSAGYSIVFGAYFASYTATLLYALLNHWPQLRAGMQTSARQIVQLFHRAARRKSLENDDKRDSEYDIHYHLMRRAYPETPGWWFSAILLASIIVGIIMVEVYHTTMPVWGIFFCVALVFIFVVPAGIIQAISNVQVTLVVLAEVIPGVAIPGRPYANMIFKMYGWVSLLQAILYVQDQKLAHYLHLPPRATFRSQMWGCLVGSFITIGVVNWQSQAVSDLCSPKQADLLTCPYYTTFFSSALLFGVVGPSRLYVGRHGLYRWLMFAFLIGAVLTLLAWLLKRRFPKSKWLASINIPVVLYGTALYAPYNWAYIWSGVPLAWFFMHYVYRRFPAWWNKYVYLLSIGLTVGAALSAVIQFFAITFPGAKLVWWGTTFYTSGCDGLGCVLKQLPSIGYFGPGPGEF